MKEHGFLFNSEMVSAIRAGIKTQTRRLLDCKSSYCNTAKIHELDFDNEAYIYGDSPELWVHDELKDFGDYVYCRYKPGDLIYVRETYAVNDASDLAYRADGEEPIDGDGYYWTPKWIPSIHMPKRMARIWLEIVSVRPERLQSMTEADARAEGIKTPLNPFRALWDSIYKDRGQGWDKNPFVWRIEFKQSEHNKSVCAPLTDKNNEEEAANDEN